MLSNHLLSASSTIAYQCMAQLIVPYYGGCKNSIIAKVYAGGARRSDHATPLITLLKWLRIEKKVIFEVAVNIFKIKSKLIPDRFMQFPTTNEILQNSDTTWQQHNLYVFHTNTDHSERSFIVLGPKIWNALPDNVTNSLTLQVFRIRLKAFLMNNDVSIH